jgi:cobalt/nickel transport system permease protein
VHIPDGFIDLPTAAATGVVAFGAVAWSVRKTGNDLGERTVPLLGVTAAFVFAAQLLNFPIAAGTSGHFLGALLAAALLGPWAATLTLTVVIVAQALIMADGGVTALGANITNMAVVAVFAGYGAFLLLKRLLPRTPTGYLISVAVASWFSVVASAAAAAVQLGLSGTVPLAAALPAMVSVHMVIGLGEALITAAIVSAVLVARPDLVASFDLPRESIRRTRGMKMKGTSRVWTFVVAGVVVAAALALFVSPFASRAPDGLRSVVATQGATPAQSATPARGEAPAQGTQVSGTGSVWQFSPLGNYRLPGIQSEGLSTALAGLIGTIAIFVLVVGAGRVLGRGRPSRC